jgi:hypothetical protein
VRVTAVPKPNTGALKFVPLAGGLVAGIAAGYGIKAMLPEPDRVKELQGRGIDAMSSRQASVYAMAAPFSIAAGIGLGLKGRTPTSGLTTGSQIATAALLSTVAGSVINADSDKAGDYVTGIGVMSALTGVGILAGVRDEVSHGIVRMSGLALFGAAIGVGIPMMIDSASNVPERIRNGLAHRE